MTFAASVAGRVLAARFQGEGKPLTFIQEASKLDNDPWVILPEQAKPGQKYKKKLSYKEISIHDSRIIFNRGAIPVQGDNFPDCCLPTDSFASHQYPNKYCGFIYNWPLPPVIMAHIQVFQIAINCDGAIPQ